MDSQEVVSDPLQANEDVQNVGVSSSANAIVPPVLATLRNLFAERFVAIWHNKLPPAKLVVLPSTVFVVVASFFGVFLSKVRPIAGAIFFLAVLSLSLPSAALAHAVIATVPVGNGPASVAITPNGLSVYVTNLKDNTVSVIGTATNTVIATIPVGNGPQGIAITPNGSFAYVTNYLSNTISVIDIATNAVVATVPVGNTPVAIAITPSGTHAYVTDVGSNSVAVVDTVSNVVVATVPVGIAPDGVAISPNGGFAYVSNYSSGSVSIIDTLTNTVVTTVKVAQGTGGVAITPNGSSAYVASAGITFVRNSVSVIDTSTNTVAAIVSVGNGPVGIAISPNGNYAYVTNEIEVNGTVSVIEVATNTVITTASVGSNPNGVAFTPNGNSAYVTNYGGNNVSVISVPAIPTTTKITPFSSISLGQSVTVEVTVAAQATGSSPPTGTVTITDGSENCAATLAGGIGSCALTPTKTGLLTISARYSGDINFIASSAVCPIAVSDLYVALNPARLLDTRTGVGITTVDGVAQGTGSIAASSTYKLPITNRAGIPPGVVAVALNVTPVNPTVPGYLTLWSGADALPNASNLNFNPGYTIPNLVISPVDSSGNVAIYNGSTAGQQVVVDVQGYFPVGSAYVPMNPQRYLDTRSGYMTVDGQAQGIGALAKGGRFNLAVAGRTSIPASGVDAVIFNLAAVQPASAGYITAWPSGSAQPIASNLNLNNRLTIPNLVISGLGSGMVSLYNGGLPGTAATDLIADVQGWFPSNSGYAAVVPARLLDTRSGQTTIDGQYAAVGALASNDALDLQVTGRGGVPSGTSAGAVVLNVTAVQPTVHGYITIWPMGAVQPLASNLNLNPGTTIPNLVIAKVGDNGRVSIFNGSQAPTDILVDVQGWLPMVH